MAENLLFQKYDIPPSEVYKRGPYLHSQLENFVGNSYTIPELRDDTYIGKLRAHYELARKKEREFYDEVGVIDAQDFSRRFLYGFDNDTSAENDNRKMTKIVQKILVNIDSSLALVSGIAKSKIESKLDKLAKEIVEGDTETFKQIQQSTEGNALEVLLDFLNKNIGKDEGQISSKSGSIKVTFPKRKLSSKFSAYIIELLCQEDPQIRDYFKLTPQQKINKYKSYFMEQCNLEGIPEENAKAYWTRINKQLLSLKPHGADKGNLSAFSNIFGAEGALGEISIAITFEDIFSGKASVNVLANDVVTSEKKTYDTSNGVMVLTKKDGAPVSLTYKSPTDLVVTVGNKVYPIQVKTTYSALSPEKTLKLQGNIQASTLIGNLVSGGFMSEDTAMLFIYTLVNLSTEGVMGLSGVNDKIDMTMRILQMCIEYFAESHYSRELSEELTTKNMNNNMGNMFFVYSGQLVPMSSFIAAAISAMEGKSLIVGPAYADMVSYGQKYSTEEIVKENLEGRIHLGQNVYDKTKIRELSFIIGQLDDQMQKALKN